MFAPPTSLTQNVKFDQHLTLSHCHLFYAVKPRLTYNSTKALLVICCRWALNMDSDPLLQNNMLGSAWLLFEAATSF